jgi:hypothetical protein
MNLCARCNDTIESRPPSHRMDFNTFNPRSPEESVARDVARVLNDLENLNVYLALAKRFGPSRMFRILAIVKAVPDHLIRKSRGALFTWLIQRYEHDSFESGDRSGH